MKKNILLFSLIFLVSTLAVSQVSINTNSPQGVFHIDAAYDNATVSSNRFKNDVIVDSSGSLILGSSTQSPKGLAKVDITSDAAYGTIKLVDGGEGSGMALLGDTYGYAKWGMLKGSGGYRLSINPSVVTNMPIGSLYTFSFDNSENYISITESASYIVMVRMTVIPYGTPGRTSGYYYLRKNNTIIDVVEMYYSCINGQQFSSYTILQAFNLSAGDKIYLQAVPVVGSSWTLVPGLTAVFFYRI